MKEIHLMESYRANIMEKKTRSRPIKVRVTFSMLLNRDEGRIYEE